MCPCLVSHSCKQPSLALYVLLGIFFFIHNYKQFSSAEYCSESIKNSQLQIPLLNVICTSYSESVNSHSFKQLSSTLCCSESVNIHSYKQLSSAVCCSKSVQKSELNTVYSLQLYVAGATLNIHSYKHPSPLCCSERG